MTTTTRSPASRHGPRRTTRAQAAGRRIRFGDRPPLTSSSGRERVPGLATALDGRSAPQQENRPLIVNRPAGPPWPDGGVEVVPADARDPAFTDSPPERGRAGNLPTLNPAYAEWTPRSSPACQGRRASPPPRRRAAHCLGAWIPVPTFTAGVRGVLPEDPAGTDAERRKGGLAAPGWPATCSRPTKPSASKWRSVEHPTTFGPR